MAQNQNQLNGRCKILGLKMQDILQFMSLKYENENVSIICAFGCKKLWELVNNCLKKMELGCQVR